MDRVANATRAIISAIHDATRSLSDDEYLDVLEEVVDQCEVSLDAKRAEMMEDD